MKVYFEYDFPDVPDNKEPIKPYFAGSPSAREDVAKIHAQLEMILSEMSGLQQSQGDSNFEIVKNKAEEKMKQRMWFILKRLGLEGDFIPDDFLY